MPQVYNYTAESAQRMLSTPDRVWLKNTLPLIVDAAPILVEECKAFAVNPFSQSECLFGRKNFRAAFWAELGRRVGENLDLQWREGVLTLDESAFLSQLLTQHLWEENRRVCALAQHLESTRPP